MLQVTALARTYVFFIQYDSQPLPIQTDAIGSMFDIGVRHGHKIPIQETHFITWDCDDHLLSHDVDVNSRDGISVPT